MEVGQEPSPKDMLISYLKTWGVAWEPEFIPESVHHRTVSKALKRLKLYLDYPHARFWQRSWAELTEQEHIDILEEFALHEDYAKAGVWKSPSHQRNEEKKFLFRI